MKRTLTLRSESLAELSSDQLSEVAGAQAPPTLPLDYCFNTMQPTRCLCP